MKLKECHIIRLYGGGNYFIDFLSNTRCFCIWDKMNGTNSMADAELAWTSFSSSVRMFRMHHFSTGYDDKIHPTQKPVPLYKWLLEKYAKEGDKIIDTHLGSGSIAIACYEYGFNLTGFELDTDYFNAAKQRVENHIQSHPKLF